MQTSKYQIFKGEDSHFRFLLKSPSSETLLVSEGFVNKPRTLKAIAAAMQFSQDDRFISRRLSPAFKYYFVVKSREGRILATSELFESKKSRDKAIEAAKRAALSGTVDDLS